MPNERRSGEPGRMEEVCDQYWGIPVPQVNIW